MVVEGPQRRTLFGTPKPGAARSNRAGCANLEEKSPDWKRNASNSVPPKDRGIFLFDSVFFMRKCLTEEKFCLENSNIWGHFLTQYFLSRQIFSNIGERWLLAMVSERADCMFFNG